MLRWCSYCQEFQGEVPPFRDFRITHGICLRCKAKGAKQLDQEMEHSLFLKRCQSELMEVGERGDVEAAATIIEMARSSGIRPVEMLIGLIAPLLYIIGEGWERGKVSVAEEHRFTLFCEDVFRLVEKTSKDRDVEAQDSRGMSVVLLNAYGNDHTIATRILALWLKAKGFDALVLDPPPPPAVLSATLHNLKPSAVLISLALSEQRTAVLSMMECLRSINGHHLAVFIGGYAVKMELVAPIPGSIFMTDIAEMEEVLRRLKPY